MARPARLPLAAVALAAALSSCGGDAAPPGDARFALLDADVARDTRTGLEWTRTDGERSLPWEEAERHCRDLALGGHDDWRLPELDELVTLYDEAEAQPCARFSCHLDPAIDLTDAYVWSATPSGEARRYYLDFYLAGRLSPVLRPTLVRRVLCVRGRAAPGALTPPAGAPPPAA